MTPDELRTRLTAFAIAISRFCKPLFGRPETRNIADQKVGQCRYSLVCNESGGVLDDVIISKDVKNWIMVCNASNREKLVQHFHKVRHDEDLDFDFADNTEATAMVVVFDSAPPF